MTHLYYPELARQLFELAVEIKEKLDILLDFINLSGGIGVNYRPDQEPNDIALIGEGVRQVYEEVLTPAGLGQVKNFYRTRTLYVGTSWNFGHNSYS